MLMPTPVQPCTCVPFACSVLAWFITYLETRVWYLMVFIILQLSSGNCFGRFFKIFLHVRIFDIIQSKKHGIICGNLHCTKFWYHAFHGIFTSVLLVFLRFCFLEIGMESKAIINEDIACQLIFFFPVLLLNFCFFFLYILRLGG